MSHFIKKGGGEGEGGWYHCVNTLSEPKKPLVNVMTVNLPVEDYYI